MTTAHVPARGNTPHAASFATHVAPPPHLPTFLSPLPPPSPPFLPPLAHPLPPRAEPLPTHPSPSHLGTPQQRQWASLQRPAGSSTAAPQAHGRQPPRSCSPAGWQQQPPAPFPLQEASGESPSNASVCLTRDAAGPAAARCAPRPRLIAPAAAAEEAPPAQLPGPGACKQAKSGEHRQRFNHL